MGSHLDHASWSQRPHSPAGGLDYTAKDGKRQGREVPQSLRLKPGAKHPVWKTQLAYARQLLKAF